MKNETEQSVAGYGPQLVARQGLWLASTLFLHRGPLPEP